MDLLYLHLDLFEKYAEEYSATHGREPSSEPLKHFFKIYVNNFPGAGELRARMMETHSVEEVRRLLAEWREEGASHTR